MNGSELAGDSCTQQAEWVIYHGPRSDDFTHACTAHVGELLNEGENRVLPVESGVDADCCFIGSFQGGKS